MDRHAQIVRAFEEDTIWCLWHCMSRPGEVETAGSIIGCLNGIDAHDDKHLPVKWSAFYVLHNEGCRVWGSSVEMTPEEGDVFALNIHKRHGVTARRKSNQVFAAIYADGDTKHEALSNLKELLSCATSQSQG